MTALPTLDSVDVAGKRILVRADLNVPLDAGRVVDDFRIRATLPTVERLRSSGARVVVLCSHLGRPKGADPAFAMDPVAARLSELGGFPVRKLDGVVGPEVEAAVYDAEPGDVIVLENTRFEAGESANDPLLADGLAALADIFVLDAFGSAHRAHASTVGVAERIPSVAGPLLAAEVKALSVLLEDPPRPFVVVLGGAKVSDKLSVMRSLLPRVDAMLVGGGMCFTLLVALGHPIGSSLFEEERLPDVGDLLAGEHGGKIVLPPDIVVAAEFAADAAHATVASDAMPGTGLGLDIGPATVDLFSKEITGAGSVFWNGPMGVFEWEAFRAGTEGVARAVAETEAFTVVGGGDSVAAIRMLGVDDAVGHVSTGGGAGLEMLEGKELPGVAALRKWGRDA